MNVAQSIVQAAQAQDQEKFDRIFSRLAYEFHPVSSGNGPLAWSALSLILSQISNDQDFCIVSKMAWNSSCFALKDKHDYTPIEKDVEDPGKKLMLIFGVCTHTDRLHLLPHLLQSFLDDIEPKLEQIQKSRSQFQVNVLAKWLSQSKFLDWSKHASLYEQLSEGAAANCDKGIASACSRSSNSSVLFMLKSLNRLSSTDVAFYVFNCVKKCEEITGAKFVESDFEIASWMSGEELLDIFLTSDQEGMLHKSAFCDVIKYLKDPDPSQKLFHPKLIPLFLELVNPTPNARQLEELEKMCFNVAAKDYPELHAFVQKHRMRQIISDHDRPSAPRSIM